MIRWLVIGLLLFSLTTGVRRGWLQVRWGLMLHELGMPFVPEPAAQAGCPGTPAASVSSASEAR